MFISQFSKKTSNSSPKLVKKIMDNLTPNNNVVEPSHLTTKRSISSWANGEKEQNSVKQQHNVQQNKTPLINENSQFDNIAEATQNQNIRVLPNAEPHNLFQSTNLKDVSLGQSKLLGQMQSNPSGNVLAEESDEEDTSNESEQEPEDRIENNQNSNLNKDANLVEPRPPKFTEQEHQKPKSDNFIQTPSQTMMEENTTNIISIPVFTKAKPESASQLINPDLNNPLKGLFPLPALKYQSGDQQYAPSAGYNNPPLFDLNSRGNLRNILKSIIEPTRNQINLPSANNPLINPNNNLLSSRNFATANANNPEGNIFNARRKLDPVVGTSPFNQRSKSNSKTSSDETHLAIKTSPTSSNENRGLQLSESNNNVISANQFTVILKDLEKKVEGIADLVKKTCGKGYSLNENDSHSSNPQVGQQPMQPLKENMINHPQLLRNSNSAAEDNNQYQLDPVIEQQIKNANHVVDSLQENSGRLLNTASHIADSLRKEIEEIDIQRPRPSTNQEQNNLNNNLSPLQSSAFTGRQSEKMINCNQDPGNSRCTNENFEMVGTPSSSLHQPQTALNNLGKQHVLNNPSTDLESNDEIACTSGKGNEFVSCANGFDDKVGEVHDASQTNGSPIQNQKLITKNKFKPLVPIQEFSQPKKSMQANSDQKITKFNIPPQEAASCKSGNCLANRNGNILDDHSQNPVQKLFIGRATVPTDTNESTTCTEAYEEQPVYHSDNHQNTHPQPKAASLDKNMDVELFTQDPYSSIYSPNHVHIPLENLPNSLKLLKPIRNFGSKNHKDNILRSPINEALHHFQHDPTTPSPVVLEKYVVNEKVSTINPVIRKLTTDEEKQNPLFIKPTPADFNKNKEPTKDLVGAKSAEVSENKHTVNPYRVFGKIVPQMTDTGLSSHPIKALFLGNGLKLPLNAEINEDGSYQLFLDMEKICNNCDDRLCKEKSQIQQQHLLEAMNNPNNKLVVNNIHESNSNNALDKHDKLTTPIEMISERQPLIEQPIQNVNRHFQRFNQEVEAPRLSKRDVKYSLVENRDDDSNTIVKNTEQYSYIPMPNANQNTNKFQDYKNENKLNSNIVATKQLTEFVTKRDALLQHVVNWFKVFTKDVHNK